MPTSTQALSIRATSQRCRTRNLLTSCLKCMVTHTAVSFLCFSGACCVIATAMSGYCVNTTSIPKISSRTVNSTSKNGMLMKSRCPVNRTSNFHCAHFGCTVNRTSKTERISNNGRRVNTTSCQLSPSRTVNRTSKTERISQSGCHVNMTSLASVSAYVLC